MTEMPLQPPPAPPPGPAQQRIVLPPHRQRAHRPWQVRAREWAHRNLFPSRTGTAMTLAAAALIGGLLAGIVWFVFFDANWAVVTANRWLLFAGGFDHEQAWRLWFCMALIFALIGAAYGTWSSLGRKDHLFIALVGAFVLFLMAHGGATISNAPEATQRSVEETIAIHDESGRAAAIEHLTTQAAGDSDGYTYAVDATNGEILAHQLDRTLDAPLSGRRITDPEIGVDGDGREFGTEILGASEDGIWVEYEHVHPTRGTDGRKHTWAVRRGDLIFAEGYYVLTPAPWSSIWFLLSVVALYAAYAITRRLPRDDSRGRQRQVRITGGLLALSLPIALGVLLIGSGTRADDLDGFVLNLILAPVGIVGGLLVGIPLALGRNSKMRAISWTCTAYIEIIRGAPLLGWLFVALFILGDVIGGSLVIRVMVTLAVFTGAYMAEYIRGGLQALPRGQNEAARAVGLTPMQATRMITLPQALRISIPPMVGQAISIWKDTTLVTVILPLRELKGNADSAIAQLQFTPDRIEAYVFVAVVFWVVAFMMSRISQRTERALGVGER